MQGRLHTLAHTLACGKEKRVALQVFAVAIFAACCLNNELVLETFTGWIGLRFLPHFVATEMWIITVAPEAVLQRVKQTSAEINIPSPGPGVECWVAVI